MNFQPRFLRISALPMPSILLIIAVGGLCPVLATTPQGESEAERYVLLKAQKGELANLKALPEGKRKLRASFVVKLLTSRDAHLKISSERIAIAGAVITGDLDLVGAEIPYDVSLDCIFDEFADFTESHFAKNVMLMGVKFNKGVDFAGATIGLDFLAEGCSFSKLQAGFEGMRVGRDFIVAHSTFDSGIASFDGVRVGRDFLARIIHELRSKSISLR